MKLNPSTLLFENLTQADAPLLRELTDRLAKGGKVFDHPIAQEWFACCGIEKDRWAVVGYLMLTKMLTSIVNYFFDLAETLDEK